MLAALQGTPCTRGLQPSHESGKTHLESAKSCSLRSHLLFKKPSFQSCRLRRARGERRLRARGLLTGFKRTPGSARYGLPRISKEVGADNDAQRESIACRRILSLTELPA